jgi:hypothetical protein
MTKAILAGIGVIASAVFVSVAASLILAWPFMWLWNYAVCGAVNVATPIEYWRAFWLLTFLMLFAKSTSQSSK